MLMFHLNILALFLLVKYAYRQQMCVTTFWFEKIKQVAEQRSRTSYCD
jgi:hypothetical protein